MECNTCIFLIGGGVSAWALLPLLAKHLRVPDAMIVVIDFADRTTVSKLWSKKGLGLFPERVTPFCRARVLSTHLRHESKAQRA